MARCKQCGRMVAYVRGESGKTVIVDPEPVWVIPREGAQIVATMDGRIRRGRTVPKGTPGAIMAYVPHYTTCMRRKEISQHEYRKAQRDKRIKLPPFRKKELEKRQEGRTETAEQLRLFGEREWNNKSI